MAEKKIRDVVDCSELTLAEDAVALRRVLALEGVRARASAAKRTYMSMPFSSKALRTLQSVISPAAAEPQFSSLAWKPEEIVSVRRSSLAVVSLSSLLQGGRDLSREVVFRCGGLVRLILGDLEDVVLTEPASSVATLP